MTDDPQRREGGASDRDRSEGDATSVDAPSGRPPDHDMPYDPAMTEGDEANIPPESDVDPEGGDG